MSQKFSGKVAALLKEIDRSKNVPWTLARIKQDESPSDIRRLVATLMNQGRSSEFAGELFPQSVDLLGHSKIPRTRDFRREVFWFLACLRPFAKDVEAFLQYETRFSNALFRGELAEALQELDGLEKLQGISLWSIENRFLVLKQSDPAGAAELLSKIHASDKIYQDVKAVLAYDDLRFDPEITADAYTDVIEELLADLKQQGWTQSEIDPVRFRLHPWWGSIASYNAVLQDLQRLALADRYCGFLILAHQLIGSGDPTFVTALKGALVDSQLAVSDYRFENILSFLGISIPKRWDETDSLLLSAIETYSCGEYSRCIDICSRAIQTSPAYSEFYELLSKSLLRESCDHAFNKKSLVGKLIDAQRSIFSRGVEYQSALNVLSAEAIRFGFSPWATLIIAFLQRECRPYLAQNLQHSYVFDGLMLRPWNPRRLLGSTGCKCASPGPEIRKYMSERATAITHLLEHAYSSDYSCSAFERELAVIENVRGKRLLARKKLQGKQIADARQLLEELEKTGLHALDADDVAVDLVACYRLQGDSRELVRTLAQIALTNRELWRKLPVASMVKVLQSRHWVEVSDLIEWPLVLEVASRGFAQGFDLYIADAVEDLLASQGLHSPSELSADIAKFDLRLVAYFLQHVCTEKNLETSLLFDSREALEAERIATCQLAMSILGSAEDKNPLQEEVKALSQRSIVRQRLTEISQGKIFVDVEGLMAQIDEKHSTNFAHYVQLRERRPIRLSAARVVKAGNSLEIHLVPDPRFQVFKRFFQEFRDRFLLSPRHGLDAYLSVRIRHGTLEGQLRKVFSQNNLVTTQDENGTYRENAYWNPHLSHLEENARDAVHNAFREFSATVDSLIEVVRTKWMQVRTEKRATQGLFDYRYSDFELLAFEQKLMSISGYTEFLDKCIELFWDTTESNLAVIRQRLTDELFKDLYDALRALQTNLEQVMALERTELLRAILMAGTALQDELRVAAEWFHIQQTSATRDYPLDLPVYIGEEIVKNIHPKTRLTIRQSGLAQFQLRGVTLPYLVDIVFIMLDNVIKHSGKTNPAVTIGAHADGALLVLEFINEVAIDTPGASLETRRERLLEIQSTLDRDHSYSRVNLEGGTGLHKVKKIVTVDLRSDCKIDFGISEESQYMTRLAIQMDKVICETSAR